MESSPAKPQSYQWPEPTWSYRPRLRAEFSRLLDLRMWRRILVIVALLAVVAAWALKCAFPELEFDWFAALAKAAGILVFYVAAMSVVFWLWPPRINIGCKGISQQTGSSQSIILRQNIRCITIDTADAARPWLRVESAGRSFECGIATKVSPAVLAHFLREEFHEISVVEKT